MSRMTMRDARNVQKLIGAFMSLRDHSGSRPTEAGVNGDDVCWALIQLADTSTDALDGSAYQFESNYTGAGVRRYWPKPEGWKGER